MRAVVTGGAGFIGSHLVDYLIERGDKVIVLDNLSTGRVENLNRKAEFFNYDITNYYQMRSIFRRAEREGFDHVFHLAALPKVAYSFKQPFITHKTNVGGTLNIIDVSAQFKFKRLVFSSSSSVYGNQLSLPLREDMNVNPMSPYGIQKFDAEKNCCFLSGAKAPNGGKCPSIVSLRYFNVYGPRQAANDSYAAVISIFLENLKNGKTSMIFGDGRQTRDFTHVSDVVLANILAAESEKITGGEVINIGAGKNYSVNQISEIVGGTYDHGPARPGDVRDTLADITKAKELLGWEPKVSLEEGITGLKRLYGLE